MARELLMEKKLRAWAEEKGVKVVSVRRHHHLVAVIERSGHRRTVTMSVTPSDHRAELNARSVFNRVVKQIEEKEKHNGS